ncbi:SDR family oxidoreductase [Asticcacaulis solisilvae]|uniref:SDR family oxidoreductase n=1 Tax=Asticcacaulis solisilvae TaxID=1217274 RepID=UPI003FD7CBE7
MSTLLVTGAAGKLGRHVVNLLLEQGGNTVIAASRDPSKLADLTAKGAEARRADFDDPASLEAAFKGVDRVLIISTDALGVPGKRLEQHTNAVNAARAAGVKEVVYTSMPNPETSAVLFAPDHLGTEKAIKASGLAYTILRNAWYAENLLHSLPAAFASGNWYTASGDGVIPYVAHDDCARAAAAALSKPAANQTLDITGPEAVSPDQMAAIAREVTGKPLNVVKVTDEQLADGLKHAGFPDVLIPTFVSFDTATRQGDFDRVSSDIETLTGRKPETLKAVFEANKAAF